MRHIYYFTFAILLIPSTFFAQNTITGRVLAAEERNPLDRATIKIKDVSIGTFSDENGNFELGNIPDGEWQLEAHHLGFVTFVRRLTVAGGETVSLGDLTLREDVMGLEEVVLTGSMRPTSVGISPVKIQVVQSEYMLQTTSPTNLMEGINLINGVQEVVACGVCFTNNISINGLPGAYTAVLLDGAPIYGNLASVYGLNGIPTNIIDRIEVIKGPNSTLYGSEAMAGVLNIITKDPATQPALAVDLQANTSPCVVAWRSTASAG
ncbi:MAG: TonB-dependent receptor [Bacteroidota bacterium]